MKKLFCWTVGMGLFLLAVAAALVWAADVWGRKFAEQRLAELSGLETRLGSLKIHWLARSVDFRDLEMNNRPEFGGGTFLHLSEVGMSFDDSARRQGRVRFKRFRVHLTELHVIENQEGRKNTDSLRLKEMFAVPISGVSGQSQSPSSSPWKFAGIERLEISLGRARFTSERYPDRSFDRQLGAANRVFTDLDTAESWQTAAFLLVAQMGFSTLLENALQPPP